MGGMSRQSTVKSGSVGSGGGAAHVDRKVLAQEGRLLQVIERLALEGGKDVGRSGRVEQIEENEDAR